MLGFPDQREQMPMLNNLAVRAAEVWVYYDFALRLEFLDREGLGKFRLDYWPLELIDAIEQVKAVGGDAGKGGYFRFKVTADASGLRIEIPVKHVMVEERGEDVHAAFAVTIDVFCDYVKVERLTLTREFTETRAAFLARKTIAIAVPYAYPGPGKYLMDVLVEEVAGRRQFREFAKFKQSANR